MRLNEMVVPNKDFQTSINIDFDLNSPEKIKGLIPTDSVCRYLETLLRDVISPSNQRAKLLVGAYGKGKSYVVLAALATMWIKNPELFSRISNAYKMKGMRFATTFDGFISEGRRLLPVIISGSTADLRHSMLSALQRALVLGGFGELMPQTNYAGAINVIGRWQNEYPETVTRLESLTGSSVNELLSKLRNMDTAAYETFAEIYPQLTSGSTFDVLDGAEILDVYNKVLDGLPAKGISGIYVVYDEFSKYLETSIDRATFEDTKLLQDFAEACNRSDANKQLHLLLISHKSISNYIDANLPKEKVDGWRGVSGRFLEIEMLDDPNQYYELIGNAIVKNPEMWSEWRWAEDSKNERMLSRIGERYVAKGLFNEEIVDTVTHNCFPLHPLTTYIIARMSEKLAQNERTLFTFICGEGPNTFKEAIEKECGFVTPDYVYSYFEPLLRKEFYTSPLHKVFELTRSALSRVEEDSLEARIIKTIATIDIVAQYDRIAPTKDTILELFEDCGFATLDIDTALNRLVAVESIVYLRRSNSFLKLKETSGVRIDLEVANRAAALRAMRAPTEILNSVLRGSALYPSRYNEEHGMVRYFDCGFVDCASIQRCSTQASILGRSGDGEVLALYTHNADELEQARKIAETELSKRPMTIVACPKRHIDLESVLFGLEAAKQLKEEAVDDVIASEEYEIVVEDYAEMVDDFIAGFFQPELGRSVYFSDGRRRNDITRKRRLSEELSQLCDKSFKKTPRVTSESLNKRELTGTAFSSRSKILRALCGRELEPDFGFVGNGQELSMARSAFEKTGIIKELAISATEPGIPSADMEHVLSVIREFAEQANESSFSVLYNKLTGREDGIGLREGPIPLYIAFVLRDCRDEIKISRGNEECSFSATTFDDLSRDPAAYMLTRLNWTPEMADFTAKMANLFGCKTVGATRNDVAEAMRLWYVALPQVTRNSRINHAVPGDTSTPTQRAAFFKALKNVGTDSETLLFEQIPRAFGKPIGSNELAECVASEKQACDQYLEMCVLQVARDVKSIVEPAAHGDASLSSVVQDWLERNPGVSTHVFAGVNNQILDAMQHATGDESATTKRIAKAATSLRIEDWNDSRFKDLRNAITSLKEEVEGLATRDDDSAGATALKIVFVDENGTLQQRVFDKVECSGRARLLKNSIRESLDDMGGALTPEEKRQVVFDVLKELC